MKRLGSVIFALTAAILGTTTASAQPQHATAVTVDAVAAAPGPSPYCRSLSGGWRWQDPRLVLGGRYFRLVNRAYCKCLDGFTDDGGGNGNRVGLWDCKTSEWAQEWWLGGNGDGDLFRYTLTNRRTGRSLDYPASSGGSVGWQFILWDWVNSPGQDFWIYETIDRDYAIFTRLGGTNKVMDAFAADGGRNGNRVGLWWITNHQAQRWDLYYYQPY
jgi:hypothetical protein